MWKRRPYAWSVVLLGFGILVVCAFGAATPRVPVWVPIAVPALVATVSVILTIVAIISGDPFFPSGGMDDLDTEGSWGLPLIAGGMASAVLGGAVTFGYLIRVGRE